MGNSKRVRLRVLSTLSSHTLKFLKEGSGIPPSWPPVTTPLPLIKDKMLRQSHVLNRLAHWTRLTHWFWIYLHFVDRNLISSKERLQIEITTSLARGHVNCGDFLFREIMNISDPCIVLSTISCIIAWSNDKTQNKRFIMQVFLGYVMLHNGLSFS